MKSSLVRIAVLSVFAVASPALILAGNQAGGAQAANRQQTQTVVVRSETVRVEIPAEPSCVVYGHHTCPNWNDGAAFHK